MGGSFLDAIGMDFDVELEEFYKSQYLYYQKIHQCHLRDAYHAWWIAAKQIRSKDPLIECINCHKIRESNIKKCECGYYSTREAYPYYKSHVKSLKKS